MKKKGGEAKREIAISFKERGQDASPRSGIDASTNEPSTEKRENPGGGTSKHKKSPALTGNDFLQGSSASLTQRCHSDQKKNKSANLEGKRARQIHNRQREGAT